MQNYVSDSTFRGDAHSPEFWDTLQQSIPISRQPKLEAVWQTCSDAIARWQASLEAANSLVIRTEPVVPLNGILLQSLAELEPDTLHIHHPLKTYQRPHDPLQISASLSEALDAVVPTEQDAADAPIALEQRQHVVVIPELEQCFLRGMRQLPPDDSTITIPHSVVWTEAISSANSGRLEAQVITNLYFSHHVDVATVTEILYQAAYSSRFTQLKLPVAVLIDAKPWGTEFKLKSYPMDARDEFVYKTDLIRRTKQTCDRLQISYPDIKIPLATD